MFYNPFGRDFIFIFIAILVSLILHELAHAATADALGDKTARLAGRLTLNPMAHLEILGLLMMFFGPIGWARPVPVNPGNFRHPRAGMMLTALAGPASNFVLAALCLLFWRPTAMNFNSFTNTLLYVGAIVNCNLCIFNLIPLPPLDGSRILGNLLPPRQAFSYHRLEVYGPFILLLAFLLPPVRNDIFTPLFIWFHNVVFGLFGPAL